MAHELDFSTGKAGIAYKGETPWHGLGQELTAGASLETWQSEAGLDWEAKRSAVKYSRTFIDVAGAKANVSEEAPEYIVLYRSDTGRPLSIVSPKYQPVQPKQIIEFYRDLTEQHGFELETAGSLKDGRRIWALANTKNAVQLKGSDTIKLYLLLATSFDGSMSTQARWTGVRVVCNNTIEVATQGRAEVTIPHSTQFQADKVKVDLNIGNAWNEFTAQAERMSARSVSRDEAARFMLDVYYGLTTDEQMREFQAVAGNNKRAEKLNDRMVKALFESPGAHMASAKGMLWGLVNAVTYDVDYTLPARSQENRLNKSWFGEGATIKQRAWDAALKLAA